MLYIYIIHSETGRKEKSLEKFEEKWIKTNIQTLPGGGPTNIFRRRSDISTFIQDNKKWHRHRAADGDLAAPCRWRGQDRRPGSAWVLRPFLPPLCWGVRRKRRGHRLRHKGLSEAACRYHFVLSRSAALLWNRSADSNIQQATNQLILHLPPSTQQKEQNSETTQCMHTPHKNMDDRKSAQTEQKLFSFPFHLPWNFPPFPSLIR